MSTQTKTDASAGEAADASWFSGLGLGVFIHWGHASARGWELSWQMTGGVTLQKPALAPVGCEEYFANAAQFDPAAFDPDAWADLAWRAGARYVVFTAKHHDGFAMFSTALSDYSVVKHAPFGRDVTAELVDAFRARGFRIGRPSDFIRYLTRTTLRADHPWAEAGASGSLFDEVCGQRPA